MNKKDTIIEFVIERIIQVMGISAVAFVIYDLPLPY